MNEIANQPSYLDEAETAYLKMVYRYGDPDLVVYVVTDSEGDPTQDVVSATRRQSLLEGCHGPRTPRTWAILSHGPFSPGWFPIVVRDVATEDEDVILRPVPPPRAFPPDEVLVLAAEDFRGDLVIRSELDHEICIQGAIKEAERRIAFGEAGSVLVTGWGGALAIIRTNHDLIDFENPGPTTEVTRFARPC